MTCRSEFNKKLHWIRWDHVLSSLDHRGLGIRSLQAFNLSLLLKMPNSKWAEVIRAIYSVKAGNWALKAKFNRLYHLEVNKECVLAERFTNGEWHWQWSRAQIGEECRLHSILAMELNGISFTGKNDSWLWSISEEGNFQIVCHLDYNCYIRGVDIDDVSCANCGSFPESVNHVFFECDLAQQLWRAINSWVDISLPVFVNWQGRIAWLEAWQKNKDTKNILYLIIVATLCHIDIYGGFETRLFLAPNL
ncbi:uncharacterized protein [Rutidosis leptorrhynchoides]|uniref:uncharacterized protein n=1 Tax=Rutidosis leptorrhynchoides TaxID=125765 RepID=UPI003A9932D4